MQQIEPTTEDKSRLLFDQSLQIVNLSLSLKAYARRIEELEGEVVELEDKAAKTKQPSKAAK